jgi:SAM-dependent methyltransferase
VENDNMSYIQNIIDNIDSLRKDPESELEVELRFILDGRLKRPEFIKSKFNTSEIDKLIEFAKKIAILLTSQDDIKVEISQTMRIIHTEGKSPLDRISVIKELHFRNDQIRRNLTKHYIKTSIINPIYIVNKSRYDMWGSPVKFGVSEERMIDASPKSLAYNVLRAKLRLSAYLSEKWRIDLTLVKQDESITNREKIKNIGRTLFRNKDDMITPQNFVDRAPWLYADFIELEAEYVGDIDDLSERDLLISDTFFKLFEERFGVEERSAVTSEQEIISMSNIIYDVAKIINPRYARRFIPDTKMTLKRLLPQVIEASKRTYYEAIFPKVSEFWVTDKIDGKRSLVLLNYENISGRGIIISNDIKEFEFDEKDDDIKELCIADAEFVNDKLYIFDVMMFNGKNISLDDRIGFEKRIEYIPQIVELFPDMLKEKKFKRLTEKNYPERINEVYRELDTQEYKTDGIIFTECCKEYKETSSFKWKPIEKTTIDFLLKKCPKELLGKNPYIQKDGKDLYLLFVGISGYSFRRLGLSYIDEYRMIFPEFANPSYFPIQFSPSTQPYAHIYWHKRDGESLDGVICEMRYDTKKEEWILHKIRKDRDLDVKMGRYFGNDFRIAEFIWQNYQDPLTIHDMTMPYNEVIDKIYFREHESEVHRPTRAYNSFIKSKLLENFRDTEWVIDIASGKGQDLFRYAKYGIKNVLFLENDDIAISELINRKHIYAKGRNQVDSKMRVYVQKMDLNENYESNIKKIRRNRIPIPERGVPLIICNFALHYFVDTNRNRKNIVEFIKSLLADGGRFIFTAFDGQLVFNLLLQNNGMWNAFDGDALKFSIKREYDSEEFTGSGQAVKVLLPFSGGDYYDEYLINNDELDEYLRKNKIILTRSENFVINMPDFRRENARAYRKMDRNDRIYVGLHNYNVYQKGDLAFCAELTEVPEEIKDLQIKTLRKLFPTNNEKKLAKMRMTDVALYSITHPIHTQDLLDVIVEFLGEEKKINEMVVTDANASVGGDTYILLKNFKFVNAVELYGLHCDILRHNLKILCPKLFNDDHIKIHNANYLEIYSKLEQDIIYLDPPWGGPDYRKYKVLDIYYCRDNKSIEFSDFVNKRLFNKARLIIMKLPENYDFKRFSRKKFRMETRPIFHRKKDTLLYYLVVLIPILADKKKKE